MGKKAADTVLEIDAGAKQSLLNGKDTKARQNDAASGQKTKSIKGNDVTENVDENKKKAGSSWKGFFKKTKQLWPFMWPKGEIGLQLRIVACCLILATQRLVNIAIPVLYKLIVDSLTPTSQVSNSVNDVVSSVRNESEVSLLSTPLPNSDDVTTGLTTGDYQWQLICLFMLTKAFQGGSGYLNILRSFLWLRVAQNTQKKMRLRLFSHLHHLSMKWHLERKTGEVIRVMDRGVSSITMILNHVLFNIVPVIFDIVVAIIFFTAVFNPWTGLIVFVTMLTYLIATISISEWRIKFRRGMNEADNKKNAASLDSILNYETVKYYSAEDWETDRYEEAIDQYQTKEWTVNSSANLLSFIQTTVMTLGLLAGSLLCAW